MPCYYSVGSCYSVLLSQAFVLLRATCLARYKNVFVRTCLIWDTECRISDICVSCRTSHGAAQNLLCTKPTIFSHYIHNFCARNCKLPKPPLSCRSEGTKPFVHETLDLYFRATGERLCRTEEHASNLSVVRYIACYKCNIYVTITFCARKSISKIMRT